MDVLRDIEELSEELDKYVEKVKHDEVPHFICDAENHANVSLILQTLENALPRLSVIAEDLAAIELPPPESVGSQPSLSIPSEPIPPPKSSLEHEPEVVPQTSGPKVPEEKQVYLSARLPLISEVWNGSDPANYHMQIEVGDKNTPFYVTVDTGSSLLWLQSVIQNGVGYKDQNAFVPSQDGATPVDTAQDKEIVYGDARKIQMKLFEDQVNVGGLVATKQAVGAVEKPDQPNAFRKSRVNGLMGLGTALDGSVDPSRRNLAQTLYAEGKIQFPSFSFVGPRNNPQVARQQIDDKTWQQPRGEFIIGALPHDVQDEKGITWCHLRERDPHRWVVPLNQVIVNGEVLFEDQFALIDSGTSYIITSDENVKQVREKLSGQDVSLNGKKSTKLFAFEPDKLTSIEFNFGQRGDDDDPGVSRSFPLVNEDFNLGRDSNNLCISSIVTLDKNEFKFDSNYWILGGIFIDNFVVTFDFSGDHEDANGVKHEGRRIGFATLGSNGDVPAK